MLMNTDLSTTVKPSVIWRHGYAREKGWVSPLCRDAHVHSQRRRGVHICGRTHACAQDRDDRPPQKTAAFPVSMLSEGPDTESVSVLVTWLSFCLVGLAASCMSWSLKMGGAELLLGSSYRPVVFKTSSKDSATPESLMVLVRNWRHLPCQANLIGRCAGSGTETGIGQDSQQMLSSSSLSFSLPSLPLVPAPSPTSV